MRRFALLLVPCLAACAPAFDAYADAVITADRAQKSFEDKIGYTAALEKMEAAGVRPSGPPPGFWDHPNTDAVRNQAYVRQQYEQMRNQDLLMQSGATGCTPDFVTGGCF